MIGMYPNVYFKMEHREDLTDTKIIIINNSLQKNYNKFLKIPPFTAKQCAKRSWKWFKTLVTN